MKTDQTFDAAAAQAERAHTDADLLQRIARDDREAFAELYDRLARALYATALRIVADATEAEDIVQDVFLSLWEKASDFDPGRGTAFAWALTLTRDRAVARVRGRPRRAEAPARATAEEAGLKSGAGPDSALRLLGKEHAGALRAAVASLPPEQREAVELAFFSGLAQPEIAARLGETPETARARIRLGLLKLREALGGRHD
ncbi:MAG: sigK [Verrucomicrobia bacterium]|nr:sigK [Verrucomicrobiota bacterium]